MNLTEIDTFLKKLELARDDDHLREIFNEYTSNYELQTPSDPFSQEYLARQMAIYKELSLKDYSNLNEITPFDVAEMVRSPFPYCHKSSETVGDTLMAIGFLIKKMALPKGAEILEFGPGWGNTSIELAKTGYSVTAVDIEENFVNLINSRAKKEDLVNLKAVRGDFFDIENFSSKFDAVLFFESFHHCSDHNLLLTKIERVLKPGGKIVFGAEPITSDFPLPWGLRMDGQSLWAIRKNGWLELGFNRAYFTKAINRINFIIEYLDGKDGPWSQIAIARRVEDAFETFTPGSKELRTQNGIVTSLGIQGGVSSGFLVFGPFKPLSAGKYLIELFIVGTGSQFIPIEIDVVSQGGQKIHAQSQIFVSNLQNKYNLEFSLEDAVEDFEYRVKTNSDSSTLCVEKIVVRAVI